MAATPESAALARTAARAASEKLAKDIVAVDVSENLVITDVFVIVTAGSDRQIHAVVDSVEEALLRDHGVKRTRREGIGEGHWALLDFSDIVVHVFAPEDREFYQLDSLWKDCPTIDLSDVLDAEDQSAAQG